MVQGQANPFESTQPAREYFVGRGNELVRLGALLDEVRDGGATNLYLVGGGGYGKTSLLCKAVEEAESRGMLTSFVTVTDNMPPDQLLSEMIEAALECARDTHQRGEYFSDYRQAAEHSAFRLPRLVSAGTTASARDVEQDLKELLQVAKGLGLSGVLFAIDEGQRLVEMGGGNLLAKLRAAIQAIGTGFMTVLASLDDILPTIASGYPGIERFFPNVIDLGPFESESIAVAAIERRLLKRDVVFPTAIQSTIVQICELRPKEIIDICHDLFNLASTADEKSATAEMLRDVVFDRFSSEVHSVSQGLSALGPRHTSTLRYISRAATPLTCKQIAEAYCRDQEPECVERMEEIVSTEFNALVQSNLCSSDLNEGMERIFISRVVTAYILTEMFSQ